MEQLSFKVAEYEGPLDLILHLISKHKLNLYDIEIIKLVEQYMQYIENMRRLNLDISSEFLEMAARLVYMKTVMLLPKHEEQAALKQELTGQLLEYKACKEAALLLSQRGKLGEYLVRKPMQMKISAAYQLTHDPQELLAAYLNALGKKKKIVKPTAQPFEPLVTKRVVSVASRIIFVLKNIYKKGQMSFQALFYQSADRSSQVATFLAVLELIKAKRITISEDNDVLKFNGKKRR